MIQSGRIAIFVSFCAILLFFGRFSKISTQNENRINFNLVQNWATKIGEELFEMSDFMTRRKEVQDSFRQAQIVERSGARLADDIAKEIKHMADIRVNALRRIVKSLESIEYKEESYEFYNNSENFVYAHQREPDQSKEQADAEHELKIQRHELINKNNSRARSKGENITKVPKDDDDVDPCEMKFEELILTNVSGTETSVHLPIDVYEQDGNITKVIHWSTSIAKTMIANKDRDKELAWQYFCSPVGMMRQYPPSSWDFKPSDSFDCRMRPWYLLGANSPKDIIILMETSGSMTGMRMFISKYVVRFILDTLTPNDFVNVLLFNDDTTYLIECFEDLVEATTVNIIHLKNALEPIDTGNQTNVDDALNKAFDILERSRNMRKGACCNQAIMLITDGLPIDLDYIFREHNWRQKPVTYPVRIFTYLITEELPEYNNEVQVMACENRGYYVQIDTTSEVKEQVLKYLSVMARPMVVNRNEHPVSWTQIYADAMDPIMTTHDWYCKQEENQLRAVKEYMQHFDIYEPMDGIHSVDGITDIARNDEEEAIRKYIFTLSVSMPVLGKDINATLLGVAGIDVPVIDFQRVLKLYMIGVGGYAFIIDSNGNIVTHPDFRPFFQGNILKPGYMNVDMVEVEQMDDDRDPRDYNPLFLQMREEMLTHPTGSKWMHAKQHMEDMQRASRLRRHYYWSKVKDTPFTVIITYPESYGLNRAEASKDELQRLIKKGSSIPALFRKQNYKIHPDWMYCRNLTDIIEEIKLGTIEDYRFTPEEMFEYFIEKFEKMEWQPNIWLSKKQDYECDRVLMQSVIYDAKVTEWFPEDFFSRKDKGSELKKKFGVSLLFMATHSGLTRWKSLETGNFRNDVKDDFIKTNIRAIDEVWYRRAVEQINVNITNFVYSIPLNRQEDDEDEIMMTVSHAVFQKEGAKLAPVAVTGLKFKHFSFEKIAWSIIGNCPFENCANYCEENDLLCYIIDENAYVILSNNPEDHGRFFGRVANWIMQLLVDERIYTNMVIYDYQAVCYTEKNSSKTYWLEHNFANALMTPFHHLWSFFKLILTSLLSFTWIFGVQTEAGYNNLHYPETYDLPPLFNDTGNDSSKFDKDEHSRAMQRRYVIRTKLEKCDKMASLYQFNQKDKHTWFKVPAEGCNRPFVVTSIPYSNLVLVVADNTCKSQLNRVESVQFEDHPINVTYNDTLHCRKLVYSPLYRKTGKYCFNKTENLKFQKHLCSAGYKFTNNQILIFLAILLVNTNLNEKVI